MRSTRSAPALFWIQVLLVTGVVASAVTLTAVYRNAVSNRALAGRALHEYATFAAWSLRDHMVSSIRDATDEVLGPVNHGDGLHMGRGVPDAADLGHYYPWSDRCACHQPMRGPRPTRFIGLTLGADSLAVRGNRAGPEVDGWLVDAPGTMDAMGRRSRPPMDHEDIPPSRLTVAPDEQRWLTEALTVVARRARPYWGYDLVVGHEGGRTHMLAVRPMPTQWGDTVVYAVEYSQAAFQSLMQKILQTSDILPTSLLPGRDYHETLDLSVSDQSGTRLFATGPDVDRGEAGAAELPTSFGGLKVLVQLRPAVAQSLLIGGVPTSRVPLLVVVLLIALGLTLVAGVLLRREVHFATERATFVANVSHELRTPLAQIRLVIDTLRMGRAGDAATRDAAIAVADREALRLQHLVEGVLRFTRGSRHDAPRIPTDAAVEVRQIAAEFGPLAEPRDVRIVVDGAESAPIAVQQGALRQVVLNLLDNALKYGPEHGTITVTVARREHGVTVSVADQGPGIPKSDRTRVFRPFTRGQASEVSATTGSGIGLTLVRSIVQAHRGRIRIDDAAGGGALVTVDLPDET